MSTQTDAGSDQVPQGPIRAPVNRSWLIKQLIVALVMIGFGAWGLADALVVYPKRGFAAARFLEWQYLQAMQASGRLSQAGVDDPRATFADLRQRDGEKGSLSDWQRAQMAWLEALKYSGGLTPDRTRIPRDRPDETVGTPRERLEALEQEWTKADAGGKKQAPQPLAFYDIPTQWVFVSIGFPVGLYMLFLISKVIRQKYTWDPQAKVLTLPDGSSLGLSDIADFDKRKWQKFLIYLQIKPGHKPHGGTEICIDLLRHRLIEDWILEMERTIFPDRAEPPKAEEGDESEAQDAGEAPSTPQSSQQSSAQS